MCESVTLLPSQGTIWVGWGGKGKGGGCRGDLRPDPTPFIWGVGGERMKKKRRRGLSSQTDGLMGWDHNVRGSLRLPPPPTVPWEKEGRNNNTAGQDAATFVPLPLFRPSFPLEDPKGLLLLPFPPRACARELPNWTQARNPASGGRKGGGTLVG